MLVVDEEEEVEFCAPDNATLLKVAAPTAHGVVDEEPPFDPPDLAELLRAAESEDDEEPPFDPIDVEELRPPSLSAPMRAAKQELVPLPANENARDAVLGPVHTAVSEGALAPPAPAIRIYLSWDSPEAADFFSTVATDRRLSRTEIVISRGGLDGAAMYCASHPRPDLLIIDTTLRGAAMLASLDRLLAAAGPNARIIILGAVNDVTLLRELAARGVDDYMVWPVRADALADAACALFADKDRARVIAVIGARGGIGASTIAHNLAWSIAERQRARTTLVDLDLPFGTAAFDFRLEPLRSLADALAANAAANDMALECVGVSRTERLTILAAPATPHCTSDLEVDAARGLVGAARRLSSFVVLDLPHQWDPWVKQALLGADEIVLVSSPDLASLRNTDNIAKLIKAERNIDPVVVLSMTGVPKRPEVPLKEFAEALGIAPACTVAFEPNIFGAAAITGQMLGEIAPDSKAARQLDELATLLTGRDAVEALHSEPRIFEAPIPQAPARRRDARRDDADPFAGALVNRFALCGPDEVDEAPAATPSQSTVAPLQLLEPAPVEPAYIARARAAALEELDAIEKPRRPQRRGLFRALAGAAAGLCICFFAVSVYAQARSEGAALQRGERAAVAAEAPPMTAQQMSAEYQAAIRLLEAGASAEAVARLRRLADAGFAIAQYRLAKAYERGEGVEADLALARRWTERAAAAGNRSAMHDLGVYYAQGEGATRDAAAAARWFEQAAEMDLADSQFNLGLLYEQGRGVEANAGEALYWFLLAARQGDEAAAERAASLEATLTPFEIEQARDRFASFRPRPADPVANGAVAQAETHTVDGSAAPSGD
jgi:pilus assembly protein CpaE